jgi:hypothetical protein
MSLPTRWHFTPFFGYRLPKNLINADQLPVLYKPLSKKAGGYLSSKSTDYFDANAVPVSFFSVITEVFNADFNPRWKDACPRDDRAIA